MTKNNFTTLVSCRIDNETIKAIDNYDSDLRKMGRSYYINLALRRLFVDSSNKQIWEFLYTNLPLKK